MTEYYKIIDNQSPIVQNYFKLVFTRGDRVENKVPRLKWLWLCLVEIMFGEELLESLVTTSSNSGCPEEQDNARGYGEPNQLNLHIPSGIFTNLFRSHLIQVLYYKYYLQYLFISPTDTPRENEDKKTIDVTRIRFRLNKKLLYLVIPFRRVYLASALLINIAFDCLAYIISENIYVVVAVGFGVEAVRRLVKL